MNIVYNADCLEKMSTMPKGSVDMILVDLLYGKNIKEWDKIINLEDMWKCFNNVIKEDGAIVLTSIEPFTSKLIMSNIDNFNFIAVTRNIIK